MSWIGLDVGSSTIKRYHVDLEHDHTEVSAIRPTPKPMGDCPDGRHEIDAERIMQAVDDLLDQALEETPNVRGLLFSAQMHGFVWIDPAKSRFISWQDAASLEPGPNGEPFLESLRKAIPQTALRSAGMPLLPKLASGNLYARLNSGWCAGPSTRILPLDAYVLERLTGNAVSHISMAAATGLADARTGAWMPELLRAIGLGTQHMPPIRGGFTPVGAYLRNRRAIPVYPALGDHQACLLGSGARPFKDVNINIGTGGVLGQIIEQFDPAAAECRPYLNGRFIRAATSLPGGKHIDRLAGALATAMPTENIWPFLVDPIHGQAPNTVIHWDAALKALDAPIDPARAPQFVRQFYFAFADAYAKAIRASFPGATAIGFSGGAVERNPALRAHFTRATGLPAAPIKGDAIGIGFLHMAHLAAISP